MLAQVPHRDASPDERAAAEAVVARTAAQMGRDMRRRRPARKLLLRNLEHPRWDEVAARCLTCANCTMVCPTCFCTTVEDVHRPRRATRRARAPLGFLLHAWNFPTLHGGSVRGSAKSRYRQWMTHKLATWIDQFGTSGCVGCGRCITWCPVGIDITEEVARDPRQADGATKGQAHGRT